MPVNLSVKNVPDALAERLRRRAEQAHRSLQGELMVILEEAVFGNDPLTPVEALEEIQRLGLKTGDTATRMIRMDRDAR